MELETQPDLSSFPAIRTVDLGSNHLRILHLDLLPPQLEHLSYRNNGLLSDGLPFQFPNTLKSLNLEINCIYDTEQVFNWSPVLEELSLDDNRLRHVPQNLPESLKVLCISYNKLTDLTHCPQGVKKLRAYYNAIRVLGVLPPELEYLNLGYNQLTTRSFRFPLPSTLTYLNVYNNKLTELPKLPDSLEILNASSNQLVSLPTRLPKRLKMLVVNDNRIRTVKFQRQPGQEQIVLYCRNNCITHSLRPLEQAQVVKCMLVDGNWNEGFHVAAALAIQRAYRWYKVRRGMRCWARVKRFAHEYMEIAYHPDHFGRWTQIETWDQWKH